MKNVAPAALILAASTSLTGCAVIGDIFKAGIWSGVIVVVILFAIIGGAVALFKGR